MKKILSLSLALLLVCSCLAGCGGGKTWTGTHHVEIVVNDYGTITVEINADAAPLTASNFLNLAKKGFYSNSSFYRAINGFAVYGGDPNRNGTGTSGTLIDGEFTANGMTNSQSNVRGAVGMARSTHYNSASCQFYILTEDATYLDGDFAVFGYVITGINVVDNICAGVVPMNSDGYIAVANQPVIKEINVLD